MIRLHNELGFVRTDIHILPNNSRIINKLISNARRMHTKGHDRTVQSRLLMCGGLQLLHEDCKLFLLRIKFQNHSSMVLLGVPALPLAHNTLVIGNMYGQSKCGVTSWHDIFNMKNLHISLLINHVACRFTLINNIKTLLFRTENC